jgi:histidinol phosphatase-like PHP family hydrolase
MASLTACKESNVGIVNPYEGVNWAVFEPYKANLHTHTRRSDGAVDPAGVVDMYHDHGYKILALTDHDTKKTAATTWPWQEFGKDPVKLAMVAIEGNEISRFHHIGSLYSDYGDPEVASEEDAFQQIAERDGLAIFNHPGRYTESEKPGMQRSIDWYCDHLLRHPKILGLEIYNQQDRYPGDRKTWDAVLSRLLPERPVWGLANDDMHAPSKSFAYSWNILLLPELDDALVRQALIDGQFFFAHSPQGKDGPPPPVIERIAVDEQSGTIQIEATGYTSIEWISGGEVVHTGTELDLSKLSEANYVRAMIHGPEGTVVGTQPFVLVR